MGVSLSTFVDVEINAERKVHQDMSVIRNSLWFFILHGMKGAKTRFRNTQDAGLWKGEETVISGMSSEYSDSEY